MEKSLTTSGGTNATEQSARAACSTGERRLWSMGHDIEIDPDFIFNFDRAACDTDWLDSEVSLFDGCRSTIVRLSACDTHIDWPRLSVQRQVAPDRQVAVFLIHSGGTKGYLGIALWIEDVWTEHFRLHLRALVRTEVRIQNSHPANVDSQLHGLFSFVQRARSDRRLYFVVIACKRKQTGAIDVNGHRGVFGVDGSGRGRWMGLRRQNG